MNFSDSIPNTRSTYTKKLLMVTLTSISLNQTSTKGKKTIRSAN